MCVRPSIFLSEKGEQAVGREHRNTKSTSTTKQNIIPDNQHETLQVQNPAKKKKTKTRVIRAVPGNTIKKISPLSRMFFVGVGREARFFLTHPELQCLLSAGKHGLNTDRNFATVWRWEDCTSLPNAFST